MYKFLKNNDPDPGPSEIPIPVGLYSEAVLMSPTSYGFRTLESFNPLLLLLWVNKRNALNIIVSKYCKDVYTLNYLPLKKKCTSVLF